MAIAALAFIVSDILHEGVGHGGTCLLVGGAPRSLTTVYFDDDPRGLTDLASRWIAAGGPIVNLITGVLGLITLRRLHGPPGPARLFLWLVTTLGLFMATGYLLFSGVGGIGDLAVVTKGFEPRWAWRAGLTIAGGALYFVSARLMAGEFGRIAGPPSAARVARASGIARIAYVTGGVVSIVAGVLNPQGFVYVLISAAPATLGGASGLLWMMQFLHGPRSATGPELALPRRWPWIAAATAAVLVFVLVLGPGIRF